LGLALNLYGRKSATMCGEEGVRVHATARGGEPQKNFIRLTLEEQHTPGKSALGALNKHWAETRYPVRRWTPRLARGATSSRKTEVENRAKGRVDWREEKKRTRR